MEDEQGTMKKRFGHSQEGINRDCKTMRFIVEMMKRQYASMEFTLFQWERRAFKTWAPRDGMGPPSKGATGGLSLPSSIRFQNMSSWASQKATDRRSMWHGRILSAGAGALILFSNVVVFKIYFIFKINILNICCCSWSIFCFEIY